MDRVFSFTAYDVVAFFLGLCGTIVSIAGAVSVVSKAITRIKKPNADQDDRIAELEKAVERHEHLLGSDNTRLKAIEEGNRVTQKALLALLDHGIDGNNISQMQNAKIDLQNHLIER